MQSGSIPAILFKARENDDPMNEFLTHFSLDLASNAKSIIKIVNSKSNKNLNEYHKEILHSLDKQCKKSFRLKSFVPTFIALSTPNPDRAIETLISFYPIILGNQNPINQTTQSIVFFFPPIDANNDMKCVVGCLSEIAFSILAVPLLEKLDSAAESLIESILLRIFEHREIPNYDSLEFKLLEYVYNSYFSLSARLSQFNFHHFAFYFNRFFQTKNINPISLIHFCLAANGIRFSHNNFGLISDSVYEKLFHYFNDFSNDHLVCHHLFVLYSNILPQCKEIDILFGQSLERKAITYLYSPYTWASSLRLLGVLNFLNIPPSNKKYDKIIEKKVYMRFKKPKKISAALDYLISTLRPSKYVDFNWSVRLSDFCSELYPRLFKEAILQGHEYKGAELFENMAAINPSMFSTNWLHPLLIPSSNYATIALISLQHILNPMSGFEASLKRIPSNSSLTIKEIISKITNIILNYVNLLVESIPSRYPHSSTIAYEFSSVATLLDNFIPSSSLSNDSKSSTKTIYNSNSLSSCNSFINQSTTSTIFCTLLPIPTKILAFLLEFNNINPLTKMKPVQREELSSSETHAYNVIKQWEVFFEAPHDAFGKIYDRFKLDIMEACKNRLTEESALFPILPILLYYTNDYLDITNPLLTFITCPDPLVSTKASLVYELLLFSYENQWPLYINEIVKFLASNNSLSHPAFHQIVRTFHHCLEIIRSIHFNSQRVLSEDELIEANELLATCEYVSFNCLCSQFPETRMIGLSIMEVANLIEKSFSQDFNSSETSLSSSSTSSKSSGIFNNHNLNSSGHFKNQEKELSFIKFWKEKSPIIEQKLAVHVISSYSTLTVDNCPIYKLPIIPLREVVASPYLLLWKFAMREIGTEILKDPMVNFLLMIRGSFLNISIKKINLIQLSFLFSTASPFIMSNDSEQRELLASQNLKISSRIHKAINIFLNIQDIKYSNKSEKIKKNKDVNETKVNKEIEEEKDHQEMKNPQDLQESQKTKDVDEVQENKDINNHKEVKNIQPSKNEKQRVNKEMKDQLINSSDLRNDKGLAFVFTTLHISATTSLFEGFLRLIKSKDVKISTKDALLSLMSIVLRRFSMLSEFTAYLGRLIQTGLMTKLMKIFDERLDFFSKVEGIPHFQQLFPFLDQLTDFLVFRGQYFKYLHQNRLETPHGPFPRCPRSKITDLTEISPICTAEQLFKLLFKWSSLQEKSDVVKDALDLYIRLEMTPQASQSKEMSFVIKKKHDEIIQKLKILKSVSQIALSYLVSLYPVFNSSSIFNLSFQNKCVSIGVTRSNFMKNLLTQHILIFFDSYVDSAFTTPLSVASLYLSAISDQFVPAQTKDSLIYSNDTFVRNLSTCGSHNLSKEEKDYVCFLYLRTGNILLLSLFFLLHSDIRIRQNALRLLAQFVPVVLLLHDCHLQLMAKKKEYESNSHHPQPDYYKNSHSNKKAEDNLRNDSKVFNDGNDIDELLMNAFQYVPSEQCVNDVKTFLNIISEQVQLIPTQIKNTIQNSAEELSSFCSHSLYFATEQVLAMSFKALPAISNTRIECTRTEMIRLIIPWLKNISINLSNRTIVQNPLPFFIIYPPYSFVYELFTCFYSITDDKSPLNENDLAFWRNLTIHSISPAENIKFIVISIVDIATGYPGYRTFAKAVLAYIYRLYPKVAHFVVPLLHFGNWYFQHVQLGRFEEIGDMAAFLNNGKTRKLIKDYDEELNSNLRKSTPWILSSNSKKRISLTENELNETGSPFSDNYSDSTDFALETLIALATEDIVPLVPDLSVIFSYCLTHIKQKGSFTLLASCISLLRSSFDCGIPECILNGAELCTHIQSVDFDQITFIHEKTNSPLRALQEKKVSLVDLLDMIIKILDVLPDEQETSLSDMLILWGVSCGNLEIAAEALNVFAENESFSQDLEPRLVFLLIESVCLVTRCLITSKPEEKSTHRVKNYINSALKVLQMISRALIVRKEIEHYELIFWLSISLLAIEEKLLSEIIDEDLKLIIILIEGHCFDDSSQYSHFNQNAIINGLRLNIQVDDLRPFLFNIPKQVHDIAVMITFILNLLKFPISILSSDSDFSDFIIIYTPLIFTYIDSPQKIATITNANEFIDAISKLKSLFSMTHLEKLLDQVISGNISNLTTFSMEFTQTVSQLYPQEIFIKAADYASSLATMSSFFSMDVLLIMATSILAVSPSKDVFTKLIPLTRITTLNRSPAAFSTQIRFLKSALSSGNADQLAKLLSNSEDTLNSRVFTYDSHLDPAFHYIQSIAQAQLHVSYDTMNVLKVRFDSVDVYPPIFPFEQQFLECKCIEEVTNFCRKLLVNPFTNWSVSLYKGQDPSEIKADESDKPVLNFSVDYSAIIAQMMEEVMTHEENEEESQEEIDQFPMTLEKSEYEQFEPVTPMIDNGESDMDEMKQIDPRLFLPSFNKCDQILKAVLHS